MALYYLSSSDFTDCICGSTAVNYIVSSVNRYIGCIIDQSKWSGPFSLVLTPDFYLGDQSLRPALAGCFSLQVYISPPTTHSLSLITDYVFHVVSYSPQSWEVFVC